jgi:hypothetical protein
MPAKDIDRVENDAPGWMSAVATSWLTSLVVLFAILFGAQYLSPPTGISRPAAGPMLSHFSNWDGHSYIRMASEGYPRAVDQRREWAFFPGYPLVIRAVVACTSMASVLAAVLISNLLLIFCCWLFYIYLVNKHGPFVALSAVTALACWPPGFFFRVAYSESLFLTGVLLSLVAMQRRWHPLLIATIIGACTGIRPVGVALLLPFAVHLYPYIRLGLAAKKNILLRIAIACGLWLIAIWGLVAFVGFQKAALGDPTAFVSVQSTEYRMRPVIPWKQKIVKLLTLEPIRRAYDDSPDVGEHWSRAGNFTMEGNPVLTFRFWNPIFFLAAVILVVIGGFCRWLSALELCLGFGLLAIPYYTRAYEFAMCSQARFTDVCVPAFVVLGRMLAALPDTARTLLAISAAALMMAFAAEFSAAYPVF